MDQCKLLGMLTPSSNTVLEPICTALVADLPAVSVHFSRFPVTEISLRPSALNQFEFEPMLAAAQLLADANVDVIAWNGTSAGWLGFDKDIELCQHISARTRIGSTSSVLALAEIMRDQGVEHMGLVTPYTADVQDRIIDTFAGEGFTCVAEAHSNLSVNFDFACVDRDSLRKMIYAVAQASPQAVLTFCTNLRAAPLVQELEEELGIPIYDSISAVMWKCLRLCGEDPAQIKGWGSLFLKGALQC